MNRLKKHIVNIFYPEFDLVIEKLKSENNQLKQDLEDAKVNISKNEEKFNAIFDDLSQSNRELEQFAYVVSHDLKAPLRGIHNITSWIIKDFWDRFDDEGRSNLSLLQNTADKMSSLIDGILQHSKIGRMKAFLEEIEVATIVNGVLEVMEIPDSINVKIGTHLPRIIYSEIHLIQIFGNLIENAIAHIKESNGEIVISWILGDYQFYTFMVSDDGTGIDKKNHEKIFELFQNLGENHNSTSTGIGLALVKRIVEVHGGTISVESKPDDGAKFYFTIPMNLEVSRMED